MSTLTVPIRIKRGVGTPSTLKQGELAFDENGQRLFIGSGVGTGGNAATVVELTTPPAVLTQLQDVSAASPSGGDVLTYDAATSEWIAQAVAAAAWADITGKPSVFTPDTHASSHHTGGADAIAPADIGAAAASHTHAASDITSGLATVATTGAYSDLSGTPTLGTAAASASTDFIAASAASAFGLELISEADAGAARTTLGIGSAGTLDSSAFADTDHSHDWTDIATGVPSTFAPSAHNHAVKQELSGFIESPEAKTYVLSPSTHAAMTIIQLRAQTSAGTVDVKIQDDGVDVTGASLADAGTTLASLASDISVVVAAGSKLTLVVSDPQSSPADLAFTVHYTVTSANNA